MLVREIMHPNPISISPEEKLSEAYARMNKHNIRHLPVIDAGKLVGIITDRDLRLATSMLSEHPFKPSEVVSKVMTSPVQTVSPQDPIELALQLMRELKIGSLPVLEEDKLVGIITGVDILDAMLKLTGIHKPSGRLDIRMKDKPGELARLTTILSERKVNIHSILSYVEKNGKLRLVLRLNTMEMRTIAESLCNSGFDIIWPTYMSCKD